MARTAQPMGKDRRARLFQAAAKEFAAGYSEASLNQILKDAGFSKSSFYHYFADKEELFNIVAGAAVEECAAKISIPGPGELSAETYWLGVRSVIDDLAENSEPGSAVQWLAVVGFQADSPKSGPIGFLRGHIQAWLVTMMRRARELGVLQTELSEGLQAQLAESILLTILSWINDHPEESESAWQALEPMLQALARR